MQPPSKRRKKSLVWDFMEQVSPTSVRCIICKGTLTYSKTTSNMTKHIQTKHPLHYAAYKGETLADSPDAPAQAAALPGDCSECPESSQTSQTTTRSHVLQQTLHDVMAKKDGYKEGGFKKKNLDDLLTNMITTDLQPMSIVEDRGFRKFVHGLDPRYILPSRRDLTRKHIPNKYHEVVQQLKNELREIPHISLTTDIWTSRQTRGFLTVTAHYICANWNMKSAVQSSSQLSRMKKAGPSTPTKIRKKRGDLSKEEKSPPRKQRFSRPEWLQQTLHDVMAKKDGYKEGGFKKKNLDDLLTNMITTDLQPMSIVEDRGFRKFVHGLDPRYILPSRRDLTRKHIPNKYHEVVQQLKNELREIPHISLTTDIWTSRQTRGFLTVTAHYICANWNMKSAVQSSSQLSRMKKAGPSTPTKIRKKRGDLSKEEKSPPRKQRFSRPEWLQVT
ncbi:hypothetical protein Pcinc_029238 [Petrolisthes cinctipes]|uniref:BED-type domain-containing protein n=1 Tax=Petrolisthes cinctipes TaxID=88211 RepID=A0AAE1F0S5_PETCI|nr:hypothetical protein Pcinc_029238 [Petrolisthes cinctipes]